MGITGLTTFVDRNLHLLKDYQLHDTSVVIDGNNLYHFLYDYYNINYRYGGNFDDYAIYVRKYFTTLLKCNITPYVVFDGAYAVDDSKLKTVLRRARDRLHQIAAVCRGERSRLIPTLAYDVFKNVISSLGIKHVTCLFEADAQVAALANALCCPVMSNDSDFFIFDLKGGFIVFDYVNLKIRSGAAAKSEVVGKKKKYLHVQIYYAQTLIDNFQNLDKSMLPLFACLYGNDVIDRQYFDHFYNTVNFPSLSNLDPVWSSQDWKSQKILKLLLWLENIPTREVAMKMALKCISSDFQCDADKVRSLMEQSIDSYCIRDGYLKSYFDTQEVTWLQQINPEVNLDHYPTWFIAGVCKGEVPTALLNVLLMRRVILRCQVENLIAPSAYACSLPLRQIIYSVVCNKNPQYSQSDTAGASFGGVCEFDRDGKTFRSKTVELVTCLPSGTVIPDLESIVGLSKVDKMAFLLEAYGIDPSKFDIIRESDEDLIFFLLVIIYWVTNADPRVDELHMYSALICAMKLCIDTYLNNEENSAKSGYIFHNLLKSCTEDDLKIAQNNLNQFHEAPTSKFMIQNIHMFTQLQAVFLASIQLNALVQNIIPTPCPSHVISGTFTYNLYGDLRKKCHPREYIVKILGKSQSLLRVLDQITDVIVQLLPSGLPLPIEEKKSRKAKKRERLRRKIKERSGNWDQSEAENTNETKQEPIQDASNSLENRFALLRLSIDSPDETEAQNVSSN